MSKGNFNKIFSISLTKSGTTSLDAALKSLGVVSTHDLKKSAKIDQACREGKHPFAYIDKRIEAVTGGTHWHDHFPLLDKTFPGSKFILLVRDMEDWLISFKRHNIQYNKTRPAGKKRPFDPIQRRKFMEDHIAKVKDYFKDRPDDLLVMNIIAGEGYEKLCPFLDIPIKKGKFPSLNSLKNKVKVYKL